MIVKALLRARDRWLDVGLSLPRFLYGLLAFLTVVVAVVAYVLRRHGPGVAWYLVTLLGLIALWSILEMIRWRIRYGRLQRSGTAATSGLTGMTDEGMPSAYPTVTFPPSVRQIASRSPSSWLGAPGADTPEISMRASVALPGLCSSRISGEIASQMPLEGREIWLTSLLEHSPLTKWLRGLKSSWPWDVDPKWEVHGSGNPELTQLRFVPAWHGASHQPLMARCAILTGWHAQANGAFTSAIEVACDLMLNVLELDENRRPGTTAHRTTPPPVPAALSLTELVQALRNLLAAPNLASMSATRILGADIHSTGEVGIWLELSGVEVSLVLKLQKLKRVQGSHNLAQHQRLSDWPFGPDMDSGKFVAGFVKELLELSGYRGVPGLPGWVHDDMGNP